MSDALIAHDEPPALPPPEAPPTTAPSASALLDAAIKSMNHPSNLDLQSKLHVMQNAINVMAAQLQPLLPTE
jgi:hypothetical protein